ncbi:MAG TPA: DUF2169 domain-containing protein [Polyangium sp.]|nr:DUF2169 domain-containing protein [Polyangium sp.]
MEVVSSCPMQTFGFVWQSSNGSFAQTIVVKATVLLEPGHAKLASSEDWEPIYQQDRFVTDTAPGIMFAPSDRVPYKRRVDVMLVGHAYAPGRTPVRSLVTKLVVGDFSKSIEVVCDRGFRAADERLLEGPRFTKMALDWSRAAGGPGTTNPVGLRFDALPDAVGLISIPNLQPPKTTVTRRADTFPPVGYGPISPTWFERAKRLEHLTSGFYPMNWDELPLPEHFDYGYFQAAPQDQQLAMIRPDEPLVLDNLHPLHAHLSTRLPGVCPRAVVLRASGEREDVTLSADTLWIDADRGICCVVWRGSIGLRHSNEAGIINVTLVEPSSESSTLDIVETMPPGIVAEHELMSMTNEVPFGYKPKDPTIPFVIANVPERPANPVLSNNDGALPFGPSGLSRLPPPPIALGQITLPAHSPTSAPTMPEIVPPAPAPAPRSLPTPPPPTPLSPTSTTEQSTWKVVSPSGPPTERDLSETMTNKPANGADASELAGSLAGDSRTSFVTTDDIVNDTVQVLWYDPASIASLCRAPRWSKWNAWFDALDVDVLDGGRHSITLDDDEAALTVLTKAPRMTARGVDEAFAGAAQRRGRFVPPTVLVSGEIELPFDEFEALKAAMSTALPLVTTADEQLSTAVATAKEFVQTPGLSAAPAVSEGLTTRVREAFVKEKATWGLDYLDTQVERVLLTGRHYQKREVFGEICARCLMWLPGETSALVGYLPADVAKTLPMWKRFRACVIAEVHLAQDPYDASSKTLKVVGLGRMA